MNEQTQTELQQFHAFVAHQLNNGGGDLSPEEVVDLWRASHPSDEELAASVAAVKRALADMEAGDRGCPAMEFLEELRQRLATSNR